LDIEQIQGGDYLYDSICKGIYNSNLFVCCLSSEYITSDNCMKEVNLALMYKKLVIALIVDNVDNRPPTAVDALIAGSLYRDFKDKTNLSVNCNELIQDIQLKLNNISQVSLTTVQNPTINTSYGVINSTTKFPSYNLAPLFATLKDNSYYKAALKAFLKKFGWKAHEFINNNLILEDIYNHFGREWDTNFFENIIKLLKDGNFYYPVKVLKISFSHGYLIRHSNTSQNNFVIQYAYNGQSDKTKDFSYDHETKKN